jgi:hypothetical protein
VVSVEGDRVQRRLPRLLSLLWSWFAVDRVAALITLFLPMWPWRWFHPADLGGRAMAVYGQVVAGTTMCAIGVWLDDLSVWFQRLQWFAVGWIWIGLLIYGWSFQGFYQPYSWLVAPAAVLLAGARRRRFVLRHALWAVFAGVVQWFVVLPTLRQVPG